MDSLLGVLGIEEKFDMLAENYDELEAEIESIARRGVLFGGVAWGSATANIHALNRRLNNFMSSARLYRDQVKHDLCQIFGADSEATSKFDDAWETEYDGRLGYRTLEALRNYAQHRDIPVHGLSFKSERKEDNGQTYVLHTIKVTLDLARIREDPSFKRTVLLELEKSGTTADLKPLVRDYMTGLQSVHAAVRHSVERTELVWIRTVADARARVCSDLADPDARLYSLLRRADDGNRVDSTPVFDDFLPRLQDLRQKNGAIRDLTKQFRSN
jgi:hypothetical protein